MPAFEMEWRDVLFASYPVDPELVRTHVPGRFEVDTIDGDAYLSVVPFVIGDIRPEGLPAAVGLTTPELNLRTYVTCDGASGVYFFSLDADDLFGVVGARLFNQLPYYLAEATVERGPPVSFVSRRRTPGARPCRFSATYEPDGDAFTPEPGTVEFFLTERYRYFTETGDGTVRYADIEHEPWTLRPATVTVETNGIFEANGFAHPDGEPLVTYSRGVGVTASASKRWKR